MATPSPRPKTARSRAAARRFRSSPAHGGRLRRALIAAVGVVVIVGAGVAIVHLRVDNVIQELTLPLRHDDIIRQQAAEKDVDASLIAAVINSESSFRDQTSTAGARGLMQITKETASHIEKQSGGTTFSFEDLADPDINIRYGTFYLRELLDRYDGNEVAALAAYNAGPGNADKWGASTMQLDDIGFPETRAYVADVLQTKVQYRDRYAKELGY